MIAALPPSVVPTPIGRGPRYHPAAATARVRAGEPVGRLRCARGGARDGVHLELFARGRVVVVPAGIGVAAPSSSRLGTVVPGGCSYPARTLTPTGVVEVRRGSRLTLGDVFRVWGQPLGRSRLVGFRGAVRAYVGGVRCTGDPRSIPLTRHAQIVLELGPYIPPHPTFLFPGGI